jgi:cyclopropane fatty-acyl-phospholipid synthase-like methyltransferase
VAQGITNIITDPDVGLTPEQLRMIPKVNKKKLNKRYRIKTCPQEYHEWQENLKSFDRVLTIDQQEKITRKVIPFVEKMREIEE